MITSKTIKEHRQNLGITQKELSERTGLSLSTIRKFEKKGLTKGTKWTSFVLLDSVLHLSNDFFI